MLKAKRNTVKAILICFICWSISAFANTPNHQAVATAHPIATEVGIKILNQGGNAFDAAVAIAAVLGVVEPYNSGLGGGGFWLLRKNGNNQKTQEVIIDAREQAPLTATPKKYINALGRVDRKKITTGPLSAGIPGQAAAFVHISNNFGKLSLSDTLKDAISLAKEGFVVDNRLEGYISYRQKILSQFPETKALYLPKGKPLKQGEKFVQADLAKTLELIAKKGHAGFYEGQVAQNILNGVNQYNADWSMKDFERYELKVREPLISMQKDYKVITMPPPSAGGIALITCLNMLANFEMDSLSEADKIHLIVESLKRAYCDRANFLGDPDFVDIPINRLISKTHAEKLSDSIKMMKATDSKSLSCDKLVPEGDHTTHFSVIDKQGNIVSATLTINHPFGSGYIAPGTGVLLNNELDDFAIKPGVSNEFNLIGHKANVIGPSRRPLSSMTPTIVESDDKIAVLGTPGGSRIPSMVLIATLELMNQGKVEDWVGVPRFHHQYMPDVILHEPNAFSKEMQNALKLRKHSLKENKRQYGNMQAIVWDKKHNKVYAASDPRGIGKAIVE